MEKQFDLTEYVELLYSVALKKTEDTYVAEDIVQETFLAAVSAMSRGKQPEDLRNWLLQVLSNKYADWLREKYHKPVVSIEDYPFDIPEEPAPEEDREKLMEDVRRELGYLAKTHREVMIRFYLRGEPIEKIAHDLQIPAGTVKSRLNTGRQRIKEGVMDMENFATQSYAPERLGISCSGGSGLNEEPFSLVEPADKLAQNVLILAYETPVTEVELGKALGVPVPFIEPIVKKLVDGELMKRTDSGKVYTDFIIYTEKDRLATFEKQKQTAREHFTLFWRETENALLALREKEYYKRQSRSAKKKLELNFCLKILIFACLCVENEITGPFPEYPYRRDGGSWIAMGNRYAVEDNFESNAEFLRYSVSGEAGRHIQNFRNTKFLELRNYDTYFGRLPYKYNFTNEHLMYLYELFVGVPEEELVASERLLQAAGDMIESGILRKEKTLQLNIPVLTLAEHQDMCRLAAEADKKVGRDIREVLLPVFESGAVKLPSHLKSVPKWQQYMYCRNSVPMAVIFEAQKRGIFLTDAGDEPIPAAVLVYEE